MAEMQVPAPKLEMFPQDVTCGPAAQQTLERALVVVEFTTGHFTARVVLPVDTLQAIADGAPQVIKAAKRAHTEQRLGLPKGLIVPNGNSRDG